MKLVVSESDESVLHPYYLNYWIILTGINIMGLSDKRELFNKKKTLKDVVKHTVESIKMHFR